MDEQAAARATSDGVRATVSLEQVRARFLQADAALRDASASIESVRTASSQLGAARESLGNTGAAVAEMVGKLESAVVALQGGVAALGESEPAQIVKRIEVVEGSIAALHAHVGNESSAIGTRQASAEAVVLEALEASGASTRGELTALRGELDKQTAALSAKVQSAYDAQKASLEQLRSSIERVNGDLQGVSSRGRRDTWVAFLLLLIALASGFAYLALRPVQ
jgi:chromosome segregation ATPase